MKAKYVNPFTDFGFKKLFGEEASKPMLMDFLNSLLPECGIVDLSFKDKENLGRSEDDRRAVYDIFCETKSGERIIVELQKAKQNFFKDRTIFYSTFPIQEQAEKGVWNYELKPVYCIGVLDFTFEDRAKPAGAGEVVHTVQLKDQNHQVFYDKLRFVYLEMPHFHKTEVELETRLDQWLYFIKHLEDFQSIPSIFRDQVFIRAFEVAEISKYTPEELAVYQENLKVYRDLHSVITTAYDEGKIEGKIEGEIEGKVKGKTEVARLMKAEGMDRALIQRMTGLSDEEIDAL